MAAQKNSKRQKCLRCLHLLRSGLTLNIPTFFLWSGVVYLATAIVIFVMEPGIEAFLCKIHIAPSKCKDCSSSELLMCPKAACYQSAMNVTIKTKATIAGDDFFDSLLESSGDWHCLQLAKAAKTPVEMATAMWKSVQPAAGLPTITSNCVKYHCEVLRTALHHPDLVLRTRSNGQTGCANIEGTKRPADSSNCVCSGLFGSMGSAGIDAKMGTAADTITKIEDMCRYKFGTTTTATTTTQKNHNPFGSSTKWINQAA